MKITDNTLQVEQIISQRANIFLRSMADEIVNISTPKTPRKLGNLRQDVLKEVLGLKGKIKWQKNYAVYQEKKQFRNYTTPGTGPHFAENGVKSGISRTGQVARTSGLIR